MSDDYMPQCFTVSNEELEAATSIAAGDSVDCDRCDEKHVVSSSDGGVLQFVRCRDKVYLVGVQSRNVIRRNNRQGV